MARASRRPTGIRRLPAAWSGLGSEQRTVLLSAVLLVVTMVLPWYSRTVDTAVGNNHVDHHTSAKAAILVFSFVEAAIFLVAAGVVALMLARGERKTFGLPGGDGFIVSLAGAWVTFLVFFRFLDKPSAGVSGAEASATYDLSWGIFFGLLAALALLAAGLRLRSSGGGEPVRRRPSGAPAGADAPRPRRAPPQERGDDVGKGSEAEREARRRARQRERDEEEGRPDWDGPERPRPSASSAPTIVDPRPDPASAPTSLAKRDPPSERTGSTRRSRGNGDDEPPGPTRVNAGGDDEPSGPTRVDARGEDEPERTSRRAPEDDGEPAAPPSRADAFEAPEFLLPRRTPREPPPPAPRERRRPADEDDDAQLSFE